MPVVIPSVQTCQVLGRVAGCCRCSAAAKPTPKRSSAARTTPRRRVASSQEEEEEEGGQCASNHPRSIGAGWRRVRGSIQAALSLWYVHAAPVKNPMLCDHQQTPMTERKFSLRIHSQDDDRKNVEEVATHCPGVTCHQVVEPRGGMDERDCEAVLRWLEALPPPPPPATAD